MSKVYKILSSIIIWILFIIGTGGFVMSTVGFISFLGGAQQSQGFESFVYTMGNIISLFLAAVAIKIKKSLD